VFPNPDHVPYLHHRFDVQTFSEHTAPMPYAPGVRTPYYLFIGQKPTGSLDYWLLTGFCGDSSNRLI
jgi:S-adenosylmethionine-diacylgycerolhomoserine-N-methlytransferase